MRHYSPGSARQYSLTRRNVLNVPPRCFVMGVLLAGLEEGWSLFNYDSIHYDLRQMAAGNEDLSKFVTSVMGSDAWLTDLYGPEE